MRSNLQIITTVTFIGLLLAGCATPQHTNTLIFGTNTKLALDISQSPTNLPSITFGYKREEAVWMPLVANIKQDGTPCDVSMTSESCLLQGTENHNGDKDTYSVLASFGAKFNGEATGVNAPNAKGGGGLAQFFATGIAARKLAEKGGARLVSVQPNDNISEEDIRKFARKIKIEDTQIDEIIKSVSDNGIFNNQKLADLVDKVNSLDVGQSVKDDIKQIDNISELKDTLINYPKAINPLFKAINQN